MGKLITRTMLTGTMSRAWKLICAGERVVGATESWGADEHAGFTEVSVRNAGRVITAMGEWLELATNGIAMRLGYRDGEVSGWVAWPALDR
jgi:hypothetical protein